MNCRARDGHARRRQQLANFQLVRNRQITGARNFGLMSAGSTMMGELSHSRWPGVVKAIAGRSPALTARAMSGK
jgi:hypothetical protein